MMLSNPAGSTGTLLMPPARYDHRPHMPIVVSRLDTRTHCPSRKNAIVVGCSTVWHGECHIIIAPRLPIPLADVMRHERAHCNGWKHS